LSGISSKRGHKEVDTALIKMARLCAVYGLYLHSKGMKGVLYESSLRIPMVEFAQSRHWFYSLEYQIRPPDQKGPFKEVDVVMIYNRQIIGIECKFPHESGLGDYDQTSDKNKLQNEFVKDELVSEFPWRYGFLLTIAEKTDFARIKSTKFVSGKNIHKERWLKNRGKEKNILDPGHGFRCEVTDGNKYYVAQIDKVLEKK